MRGFAYNMKYYSHAEELLHNIVLVVPFVILPTLPSLPLSLLQLLLLEQF